MAYCLLQLVALNPIALHAATGTAAGKKTFSPKDRGAGMLSALFL